MKSLIYIILFPILLLFTSCVLHSSAKLVKEMNCSQIKKIGIYYGFYKDNKSKDNYYILAFKPFDTVYYSQYYRIELTLDELAKTNINVCKIIDSLKYYSMQKEAASIFWEKEKKERLIKYYINMDIGLYRDKDLAFIRVLSGELSYDNFPVSDKGYITHSDKLWYYASETYFSDIALQKKLIYFMNQVIEYKNEQIRKDTTIIDSLRVEYPLIKY